MHLKIVRHSKYIRAINIREKPKQIVMYRDQSTLSCSGAGLVTRMYEKRKAASAPFALSLLTQGPPLHRVMIQISFVLLKSSFLLASVQTYFSVLGWVFQKPGLKELITYTSPFFGISSIVSYS